MLELTDPSVSKDVGDLVRAAQRDGAGAELRERLEALASECAPQVPDDAATLLTDLTGFIGRYVVLTPAQCLAVGLFILHTHLFSAADATPYLSITSAEKRSGKTRLLEVLELLVARPWFTGRVTAAVLSRKIDAVRPTLLLDESDAAFKGGEEYAETLRGILNTGHRRGGKTSCCVASGARMTYADFSTFSPKAIAGIGKLPDTVADRSIPIELKRKSREERVDRFRRRSVVPAAAELRDRTGRWAGRVELDTLAASDPEIPEQLDDRAADGWEPLLAIAELAGGDWPGLARSVALELSAGEEREDESRGVLLLTDIRKVLDAQGTRTIATRTLIHELAQDLESPWADWWNRRDGEPEKGAAQKLAAALKRHRIKSRTVRLKDDTTAKGYHREQFEDAWRRYPPAASHPSQPAPEAEPDQSTTRHTAPDVTDREGAAIAHQHSDVTDVTPEDGDDAAVPEPDRELPASSERGSGRPRFDPNDPF